MVRESQGSQGQYVLTGMQSGHHKHLLLVDPEGVVSPFPFRPILFDLKIEDKFFDPFFFPGPHQRQDVREREPFDQLPPEQRPAHHFGRECFTPQETRSALASLMKNGRPSCSSRCCRPTSSNKRFFSRPLSTLFQHSPVVPPDLIPPRKNRGQMGRHFVRVSHSSLVGKSREENISFRRQSPSSCLLRPFASCFASRNTERRVALSHLSPSSSRTRLHLLAV